MRVATITRHATQNAPLVTRITRRATNPSRAGLVTSGTRQNSRHSQLALGHDAYSSPPISQIRVHHSETQRPLKISPRPRRLSQPSPFHKCVYTIAKPTPFKISPRPRRLTQPSPFHKCVYTIAKPTPFKISPRPRRLSQPSPKLDFSIELSHS